MKCYYCDQIIAVDAAYASRAAEFDLGSEAPRCAWHWRFRCDHCGEPGHFMACFYCPPTRRLLCRAAGERHTVEGDFWAWPYWWEFACPDCDGRHPSLDRAESLGCHPWQLDADTAAARRWLSDEPFLKRYPPRRFPALPEASVTDADVDANWSANAETWDAGYDERGDRTRRYSSDPILLSFLGNVAGERVLDAGSGQGYLSRLLARRGAQMVAVEIAQRFYELALAYEQREPLGIAFHHASIANMPFLNDQSFAAAVANYVLMDVLDYVAAIAEIGRLLRPGGRFVCAISHQSLDFAWRLAAPNSPRHEDRLAWQDDDYFVRRAGAMQWGSLKPILGFHRPLRDYIAAARNAGLELRDLEEPELSAEALGVLPPYAIRQDQRAAVSYVLKFVKT